MVLEFNRSQTKVEKLHKIRSVIMFFSLETMILLSIISFGSLQPVGAQATPSCGALPIRSVSANGYDPPNSPALAFDSSLNTRWSNDGMGSWIRADLALQRVVCFVQIAWYRGDFRQNDFTISVSKDGVSFIDVFKGKSSGLTSTLETYQFTNVNARYVKITVDANTENNWASISKIVIVGFGTSSTGDGGTNPIDKFGIRKIYATKAGGEEWFMDMSDGQDSRSNPPSLTKNSDGSFKVTSTKVRYGVYTSSGYDSNKITTLNQGQLVQKGYMQSPNDWKNVEMTGYVKVNSGQSGENFAWYARGGRHTGDGYPDGCEGTAYKPDLFYDGRVRFAKEQWHVSYVFTTPKSPMGPIEDKWIGFKGIMWNSPQNGKTVVKIEIWVDKNEDGKQDGPWIKVDERTDSGGWGNSAGECGGLPDQIMTWGGPIATFRWDGATDVDIKNFSVREIQPP